MYILILLNFILKINYESNVFICTHIHIYTPVEEQLGLNTLVDNRQRFKMNLLQKIIIG